jgi:hypothetical protein
MPQGYIFLGSEDEEFNKRFMQHEFKLDESMKSFSLYDEMLSIIKGNIDNITEDQCIKYATNQKTGKTGSKQLCYALAHCILCTKHPINNMYRYCEPCEFYYHKYDKDVSI